MSAGAGAPASPRGGEDPHDLARLGDEELAERLDQLRKEELRRLGSSARDPRRARFFQDTEKLAALGVLARGMAHEFNNLFSGVIAHCDYALRGGDDDARRRALEVALASTREASAIVKNIQRFARQERSKRQLADPMAVVRRALELLRPSLKTKKLRVIERLEAIPPFVMDAMAIEQVVVNLLTNALEASEPGRPIRVELDREERLCVIAVIDEGVGIPQQNLVRLFTPFFSTKGVYARSERESRLSGTGLGLAVSYGIVRRHGGTIEVDSAPGKGSRFRVKLPMTQDGASAGEGAAGSSGAASGAGGADAGSGWSGGFPLPFATGPAPGSAAGSFPGPIAAAGSESLPAPPPRPPHQEG